MSQFEDNGLRNWPIEMLLNVNKDGEVEKRGIDVVWLKISREFYKIVGSEAVAV